MNPANVLGRFDSSTPGIPESNRVEQPSIICDSRRMMRFQKSLKGQTGEKSDMKLAELKPGLVVGLDAELVCNVVAVVPHCETAVQVIYRLTDGSIKERLLRRTRLRRSRPGWSGIEIAAIKVAAPEQRRPFDLDGGA